MKPLLGQLDRGMSCLLTELSERGLLESTLVICMGEFGRSPRLNNAAKPGREHDPHGWSLVLAGGGLKTGQVIGTTGKTGEDVEERVTTADFMATVCKALGVDGTKEHTTPDGRPNRIVDRGGKPVAGLFG